MSGGIDLPEEIAKAINDTNVSIDVVRAKLGEFLTKGKSLKELTAEFPQIEKAKLNIAIVYVLSSLYYIYLKSCGRDLEGHPIYKELSRVQLYMKKIKNIEEKNMPDNNPFRVDKVAASKFIQRGLGVYQPENTTETEAEAKKPSEAATATNTTGGEERKPAGKRERNEGTAGDGGVTVAKKKVKKAK